MSQITEVNKLLKRRQGVEVSVESSNGAALAVHNSDSFNYSGVGDGESAGVESAGFGGGIVTIGGVVDLSTVGSRDFYSVVGTHLNDGRSGTGNFTTIVSDNEFGKIHALGGINLESSCVFSRRKCKSVVNKVGGEILSVSTIDADFGCVTAVSTSCGYNFSDFLSTVSAESKSQRAVFAPG